MARLQSTFLRHALKSQSVMGNLSDKSKEYDSLTTALQDRFAPPNQAESFQVNQKFMWGIE